MSQLKWWTLNVWLVNNYISWKYMGNFLLSIPFTLLIHIIDFCPPHLPPRQSHGHDDFCPTSPQEFWHSFFFKSSLKHYKSELLLSKGHVLFLDFLWQNYLCRLSDDFYLAVTLIFFIFLWISEYLNIVYFSNLFFERMSRNYLTIQEWFTRHAEFGTKIY